MAVDAIRDAQRNVQQQEKRMTPDDIDAAIPRALVWPSEAWDTTDPEERADAVAWLYGLLSDEQGSGGISRPTDDNRGGNRNEACTVQLNGKWYTPDEALALLNRNPNA